MKQLYLEGGKVCSPHGVRGLFRTESYCDSPKVLATRKRVFLKAPDGSFIERKITSATVAGNLVLLGIEGCDSREAAQALGGRTLYLAREDIPLKKGAVLIADLLGLPVIDAGTGKVYGTVADVSDGVRTKLITVSTPGGEVLLPDVPEFVKEKDAERGILVTPIPGFFEEV